MAGNPPWRGAFKLVAGATCHQWGEGILVDGIGSLHSSAGGSFALARAAQVANLRLAWQCSVQFNGCWRPSVGNRFTVYFARGVQRHRVLRCFGPVGFQEFYVGTIKKPRVLRGFGVQGGAQNGKNDMLKVF